MLIEAKIKGAKKVTIIPFVKDEGADGDRDFIQWDTISLMSLLGVFVIVAYYSTAEKNSDYSKQNYSIEFKMKKNVKMHSLTDIDKRIGIILQGKNEFMNLSRSLAQKAQKREVNTIQPKERITDGIKAQINITNYLGGTYYLTCDEVIITNNNIQIIEAKHTRNSRLPSVDDIKEGFIKMILFSNLKDVTVNNIILNPIPVLKLTSDNKVNFNGNKLISNVIKEAKTNNFKLILPDGRSL